jgi:hypothetical protein
LKWCFAQQNMMKSDPTKWSKEDITKIERSLHKFIPLIRFYNIKPADFFYKVYNYKDILPQDLVHDLLEFHIVPNMKPKTNAPLRKSNLKFKLDSTIIESKHVPLFASWIDRRDSSRYYNENDIPYEFKLLYRSSKDGSNNQSFHRNCDNKGATICVAKIQGSTQLIGGYNPLDWGGNCGWKSTTNSFIFNFTDGKNISTAKLGYVNLTGYAVYCVDSYGPHFGDLACTEPSNFNLWWYNKCHYPDIGDISAKFIVEDYEVFQIIKK